MELPCPLCRTLLVIPQELADNVGEAVFEWECHSCDHALWQYDDSTGARLIPHLPCPACHVPVGYAANQLTVKCPSCQTVTSTMRRRQPPPSPSSSSSSASSSSSSSSSSASRVEVIEIEDDESNEQREVINLCQEPTVTVVSSASQTTSQQREAQQKERQLEMDAGLLACLQSCTVCMEPLQDNMVTYLLDIHTHSHISTNLSISFALFVVLSRQSLFVAG